MPIVLQESLRGLFYAPFCVALAQGAYAAAGGRGSFRLRATARRLQQCALFDGTVDVCWGGPMRVMETYKLIPDCDLVSFAEVVTRDPFLLVSAAPRVPISNWTDLLGLRVATVAEVPTPWMCLQEDLRRAGIAPGRLNRVGDRNMAGKRCCARCGQGGRGAVVVRAVCFGIGCRRHGTCLVHAAASRGLTSYTTFYTRRGTLTARREELWRMVHAIHRTQLWVAGATAEQIADSDCGLFPRHAPAAIRVASCARYQSLGIWSTTPVPAAPGL